MNKIAGYRVMLGLKQEDLANELGISRQAYSEKERGNIPFKDSEKESMKKMFSKIDPLITIDTIFFS